MKTKPWNFCETQKEKCTMNYCDENGCQNRKRNLVKEIEVTYTEVKVELPFYDETGKEIKEFDLLKVYHFLGVNEQGRGRKHYYMYKWVKLKQFKDAARWVATHLNNEKEDSYYHLKTVADKETRIIKGYKIIQSNQ